MSRSWTYGKGYRKRLSVALSLGSEPLERRGSVRRSFQGEVKMNIFFHQDAFLHRTGLLPLQLFDDGRHQVFGRLGA